ncbi:hypothetical protein GEMRC1_001433 [Eukaryota sp. GEM-RC1]
MNPLESRITTLSNRVSSLQSEKELELSQTQELFQNLNEMSMKINSITTDIQKLTTTNSYSLNEISKLKTEVEEIKNPVTETQLVSQSAPQSKKIRFSQTRKHSQLQVSGNGKRVVHVNCNGHTNILGEDPLLPGNVYSWKLRYQGNTTALVVGVIDESKFRVDVKCEQNAHGCRNNRSVYGCLSGNTSQWNPGELLEVSVNLINYTLSINSVSSSSINLTGTLTRLSSGNYFPYALLFCCDHVLEIVE